MAWRLAYHGENVEIERQRKSGMTAAIVAKNVAKKGSMVMTRAKRV